MKFRTLADLDRSEGSVQLVVDHDKGASLQHVRGKDIVLVPQPSRDPNDPLRWPTWRKYVTFINICAFCFLANANIGILSPGLELIAIQFQITPQKAAGLVTWSILALGCANFFWTPLAIHFGKRPVFLTASLVLFVTIIWGMDSKRYNSLLGSIIVGSFAGGATEGLGSATVNDLFFTHERATKMSIYLIFLSLGSSVGPLCGGFIIESYGWVWTKRILAVFTGVNFLMILLLSAETRFFRASELPAADEVGQEIRHKSQAPIVNEKSNTSTQSELIGSVSPERTPAPRSYLASLKPWSGRNRDTSLFETFIRPLPLALYPANVFATVIYALALSWVVIIASTIAFALSAPPYNFKPSSIGLTNISTIIGNLLGAVLTGAPSDIYVKWRARKRGGAFEPEMRLTLLLLPGTLVPAGLLLYGFSLGEGLPWPAVFVGAGGMAVGLTSLANIGMTYATESYYPVAAESLLVINGLKNIIAYGISYGGPTWIAEQGPEKAFGTMAGITLAVVLLGLIFVFFGRRIRHYTSNSLRLICW